MKINRKEIVQLGDDIFGLESIVIDLESDEPEYVEDKEEGK